MSSSSDASEEGGDEAARVAANYRVARCISLHAKGCTFNNQPLVIRCEWGNRHKFAYIKMTHRAQFEQKWQEICCEQELAVKEGKQAAAKASGVDAIVAAA